MMCGQILTTPGKIDGGKGFFNFCSVSVTSIIVDHHLGAVNSLSIGILNTYHRIWILFVFVAPSPKLERLEAKKWPWRIPSYFLGLNLGFLIPYCCN
jgi:hypothetical protein